MDHAALLPVPPGSADGLHLVAHGTVRVLRQHRVQEDHVAGRGEVRTSSK